MDFYSTMTVLHRPLGFDCWNHIVDQDRAVDISIHDGGLHFEGPTRSISARTLGRHHFSEMPGRATADRNITFVIWAFDWHVRWGGSSSGRRYHTCRQSGVSPSFARSSKPTTDECICLHRIDARLMEEPLSRLQ
ncbi:hypothetical protein AC1031_019502 [Aphanomyces cochlioides]|nr:hypothetical protein AC1031_019502 [Aphanomyces cochlioides]